MYVRVKASERGPIGSPYYIGKGKGMRAYQRTRSGRKPPPARSQIVIVADNLSEVEAFAREKALIAFYGRVSKGGCLHNLTDGGEGVSGATWKRKPLTLQQRANMARPGKSHLQTAETREKIRLANLGRKDSPERIEKSASSKRGKRCSPTTEFKKGHKQSPELIEKSAAARRGKPHPVPWLVGIKRKPETLAKMSSKLKAAWERRKAVGPVLQSTETKAKIAASMKAYQARKRLQLVRGAA
jgi:NUMOD3 motif-containing protein